MHVDMERTKACGFSAHAEALPEQDYEENAYINTYKHDSALQNIEEFCQTFPVVSLTDWLLIP